MSPFLFYFVIASRYLALRGEATSNITIRFLRAKEHCPRNDEASYVNLTRSK